MRVESVAWAAERKDVLSVFFGILTLWAYAGFVKKGGWLRYLGVAAAYSLSLLAKPMLMTLPCALLLLDYWPLCRTRSLGPSTLDATTGASRTARSFAQLLLEKVPLFALAAGIAIVTEFARDQTHAAVPLGELAISARLANALTAYGAYLVDTFYPVRLAVMYPHPMENWSLARTLAGAAVLLGGLVVSLRQRRTWPWLTVGWLWFVVSLLPVIGFSQGGPQARADRFCYWAHIGLFVAVIWGLGRAVEYWRVPEWIPKTVAATTITCLAVITWFQVGYWHDPVSLWQRALAVTEDNAEAHQHLGKYYLDHAQMEKAAAHLEEAVRIEPRSSEHRRFLTTALHRQQNGNEGQTQAVPD
jgi:hypothetical protein